MEPLYECPNPIKEYKIGRYTILTQWAKDIWEKDVDEEFRETYYIKINKVTNGHSKALSITIWKLALYIFNEEN